MTLRDKLKAAAKLKKRDDLKIQLLRRFSLHESDITIFDDDFQKIFDLADEKGIGVRVGVFEFSHFEKDFENFLKNSYLKDTISFMVSTGDDYFFEKVPLSILQQDPLFFLSDENLYFTSKNRIFIKNDMSSAFIILSSEYGLEFCQW
jgi:hypothetical protein